jgi:mannose-6-phosphate isomerase
VHTLGPGAVIVETQQQSDATFRLYDYGRPRELHLEHGLRVIKEGAASGKVSPQPFSKFGRNGNRRQPLVCSPYFTVEKFDLHNAAEFESEQRKSSPQILVAIEGSAAVETDRGGTVRFSKGDAVVVPAAIQRFTVAPESSIQFLKSYVPDSPAPPPNTSLA